VLVSPFKILKHVTRSIFRCLTSKDSKFSTYSQTSSRVANSYVYDVDTQVKHVLAALIAKDTAVYETDTSSAACGGAARAAVI